MDLTRRNFIASAAAAGTVAAVAAGAQAVPAARADEAGDAEPTLEEIVIPHTASATCASFAGCTFDMTEPAPLPVPEAWDDEADVVVAGTGGGLAGAAYAAEQGLSVIAVEKSSSFGGTSKEACMYYFATNTKCQQDAGLPDLTEMLTEAALSGYPTGEKYAKHVANCMQGIKDLVAWTEGLGLEWEPGWVDGEDKQAYAVVPKGTQDGWNSYRIMTTVENFYDQVFQENGGKYYFSTPITGLVMDGDEVVGIEATPEDTGEPIYIKANKGVILACGGFTNNISMLKAYCPRALAQCKLNTAGLYDNGDAIRIGLGAGAQLDGWNNSGFFDGGIEGVAWNHHLYAPDIQIARQPWLQIDTMGTQHVYNHSDYEAMGNEVAAMPESILHVFMDANWAEYARNFTLPMCRNLPKEDMPNQERWDGILTADWEPQIQAAIDEGRIKQGDTPEELAEAMGIAPELVTAAFEQWNAMCDSGDGTAMGYDDPSWLHKLVNPPYYGMNLGVMMYSTRCGLSIDEYMRVISTKGVTIPGLYAAGMSSGRPKNCVCGDVGYGATSAWLAAKDIVENR